MRLHETDLTILIEDPEGVTLSLEDDTNGLQAKNG